MRVAHPICSSALTLPLRSSSLLAGHTLTCTGTPESTRGYTQDEWRHMNHDRQRMARRVQFDVDSEEQREWERRAHAAWEASEHGARFRAEWGDD